MEIGTLIVQEMQVHNLFCSHTIHSDLLEFFLSINKLLGLSEFNECDLNFSQSFSWHFCFYSYRDNGLNSTIWPRYANDGKKQNSRLKILQMILLSPLFLSMHGVTVHNLYLSGFTPLILGHFGSPFFSVLLCHSPNLLSVRPKWLCLPASLLSISFRYSSIHPVAVSGPAVSWPPPRWALCPGGAWWPVSLSPPVLRDSHGTWSLSCSSIFWFTF